VPATMRNEHQDHTEMISMLVDVPQVFGPDCGCVNPCLGAIRILPSVVLFAWLSRASTTSADVEIDFC
jgi:hypothetical protein